MLGQPQVVKSFTVDQVLFAFRTGLDDPEMLARTQALAKSSRGEAQQKAVYLVGRQFQRSYEKPLMAGSRNLNSKTLKSAYGQYKIYIDKWGGARSEWLCDVRFYKAFFFLENNQLNQALVALRDMRPELDPLIYVDDIVWTENRTYSVGQAFEASKLRDLFVESINRHRKDAVLADRVQAIATELRTWCRENRYRKAGAD
jgi:hypothetical protein